MYTKNLGVDWLDTFSRIFGTVADAAPKISQAIYAAKNPTPVISIPQTLPWGSASMPFGTSPTYSPSGFSSYQAGLPSWFVPALLGVGAVYLLSGKKSH